MIGFGVSINAALTGFCLAALLSGTLAGVAIGAVQRLRQMGMAKRGRPRRVLLWVHVAAICPLLARLPPPTDKACTAPLPGASRPGTSCPSQPRTFTQETTFGNLAHQAARSARGAVGKDRRGSRCLARLRLRPTRHARRPLLARAFRAPSTRRSLVPSCRKPRSETWLNRPRALRVAPFGQGRRGSRSLARLRLSPTRHVVPFLGARASCPLEHRGPAARCGRLTVYLSAEGRQTPRSQERVAKHLAQPAARSARGAVCQDDGASRSLARLRLRPTRHARRPFLA